jgi:hypothetical protein
MQICNLEKSKFSIESSKKALHCILFYQNIRIIPISI